MIDASTPAKQSRFFEARSKLTLASIDDPNHLQVEAQYNPKELSLTQPITWTTTTPTSHRNIGVNFGGVQPQTTQIELLFDAYEKNTSVQPQIDTLKKLAAIRDVPPKKGHEPRPHVCLLVWGAGGPSGMPRISCVIESIVTKYLMFRGDGAPLRATCTVSLKEAHAVGTEAVNKDYGWYRAEDHLHVSKP